MKNRLFLDARFFIYLFFDLRRRNVGRKIIKKRKESSVTKAMDGKKDKKSN